MPTSIDTSFRLRLGVGTSGGRTSGQPALGGCLRGLRAAFDRLCGLAGTDLYLLGLGRLGDRHHNREDPVLVGRFEVVGVERVAQEDLAHEIAHGTLGGQDLDPVLGLDVALRLDRQDVVRDGEVDRVRVDAGKVEGNDELVTLAVGVDRETTPTQATPDLLGDAIELTPRVEPHEHGIHLLPRSPLPYPSTSNSGGPGLIPAAT